MAKGKSPAKQKQEYQRKQAYTPAEKLAYERCDCDSAGGFVSQVVLDRLAEQKLTAGFNVQRSNLCEGCWQYRSVNGSCGCPSE